MDPDWTRFGRTGSEKQRKGTPVDDPKAYRTALATLPEGDHPDPHCPGLIFRVQKRRRTWVFRARRAGKRLRDRLGYFPQMGLKEARLAAGEAALRAESGLRAVPGAVVHPRAAGETLGQLLDDYERMRIRENHRLKTFHRRMRDFRRGLGRICSSTQRLLPKPTCAKPMPQSSRAVRSAQAWPQGGPVAGNRFLDVAGRSSTGR